MRTRRGRIVLKIIAFRGAVIGVVLVLLDMLNPLPSLDNRRS